MPDSDLPTSSLTAIEQRVRRRARRNLILIGLTLLAVLSLAAVPGWPGGAVIAWLLWVGYAVWYLYQATVERGIRREIERERAHQLQLAREGGRVKRQDRFSHLISPEDDEGSLRADDGAPWIEEDPLLEHKPKRRLDA